MDTFQAAILGLLQGITEWLPISSSGHLVLAQTLFNIEPPLFFDVLLHFGSLLVIIGVFRKELFHVIKNRAMFTNIMIASLPILVVGFFFHDQIVNVFTNSKLVALFLIINGAILFSTEFFKKRKQDININNSLFIGIFQALAILPGISRSGMTLSAAMFSGIKKEQLISFSFLIAIIPIFAASTWELTRITIYYDITPFLVGFIVSVITSFFCLKWLINIIKKGKLSWFSTYCVALGLFFLLI